MLLGDQLPPWARKRADELAHRFPDFAVVLTTSYERPGIVKAFVTHASGGQWAASVNAAAALDELGGYEGPVSTIALLLRRIEDCLELAWSRWVAL